MSVSLLRQLAFAGFAAMLLSSCADFEHDLAAQQGGQRERMKTALAAPEPERAFWDDEGVKGAPKIVVRLTEQRATFYKGKTVIGESNISTGRKGFETPPGKYHVIQKDEKHVSNLYGSYVDEGGTVVQKNVEVGKDPVPDGAEFQGAPMPYFLRFTRGYGMHAGFVPRYRASHGCIRMPREMAKHFFDAAGLDTPVVVEE
ncbi:MAG: L,D-transpeptidase family protein [Chthoniobacterales bacterium]